MKAIKKDKKIKISAKAKAEMTRRDWAGRLKSAQIFASKGWSKKLYSPEEKRKRLGLAKMFKDKSLVFWRNTVWVDESEVPHVDLQDRDAYLAAEREHVYKKRGAKKTDKDCRLQGKHKKKALQHSKGNTKYCVAMMDDAVLVAKPVSHYIQKAGPPPKRPPQPCFPSGKTKGRRRLAKNKETTERKGSFCSR